MNGSHFKPPKRRVWIAVLALLLLVSGFLLQALPLFAATFTVNSTLDRNDASPGNGLCATSTGECTLRAAIQEANALPGADTISLPAGVYELQLAGPNQDTDSIGDFDIHTPITILGAGATASIIDGGTPGAGAPPTAVGLDRLFEIHPTAGNVTFKDVTLREGFTIGDGAAIQNWSPGLLKLENVQVLKNLAGGTGGGVNNDNPANYLWATQPAVMPKSGRVEVINATFAGNAAAMGAAINNVASGAIAIQANSQIVDNPGQMIADPLDPASMIPAPGVYEPSGGAIANQAEFGAVGSISIDNATIARNYATSDGAGIYNAGFGPITIKNATLADNTTEAEGGGLYATGGAVTINDSTIAGNHAHDGAGIYNGGATNTVGLRSRFTVANSTFTHNEAHAGGGGMVNGGDAQLILTDVTFADNKAGDEGGGLVNNGFASTDATRVTFTGNIANGEGGGAWIGSTRLSTIRDSHFINNQGGAPTPDDLANPAGANTAGGGGLYAETGPVTVIGSTFDGNTATAEGGGISLDNFGDVLIRDSIVRNNHADADGGGIENSGRRVTFERLLITNNRAEVDGGGIHNSSSGPFTIVDSTVQLNNALNGGGLANAPDNALIVRRSLFFRNTARTPGLGEGGTLEDGGRGGGIHSLADGSSLIEESTISGNTAAVGGGGIFHDADGELKLVNLTIWRNAAPIGGGVGVVESDFVPESPPQPNHSVHVRNSIIGGSLQGGSCDWYLTTEGGNIDTSNTCFLSVAVPDGTLAEGRDWRSPSFMVDAIADNGGPTLSHALPDGSLAIDSAIGTCAATDQRGVSRPQNARCDTGAYEYEGDPPPLDNEAPDTQYLTGPVQDSLTTMLFTFTGTDNLTPPEELQFECRLILIDLAEPPPVIAPWMPVPPELQWKNCSSPWQTLLVAEDIFSFEVRAVDRGLNNDGVSNIDPSPAIRIFDGLDTVPPQTSIAEKPPLTTGNRAATFTFTGTDNQTPAQFLQFECRLDTNDPDLWLECTNPMLYANLTTGSHTMEVRAIDYGDNIDPTPARYTWTVGQPVGNVNCDLANIALTAVADAWVDEVNPTENFLFYQELPVRSGASGTPAVGQNARALVRFALPNDAAGCTLESATLRLYNSSPSAGRTIEALPLTGAWLESTVTWFNQPTAATTAAATATTASTPGYQDWNVLTHVQSMLSSGVNHGWLIREATENDPTGGEQAYVSRETLQDPETMTLPILVLRYAADSTPPPPPPTAATTPTTVHCGQVLTQSTLVANDLLNCPGEGLIIGASNLVLDLNGHVIDGPDYLHNNPGGQETGFPAGIRNGGNTNVVIKNGTVQQFGYGVHLTPGTTRTTIENLTISGHALAGIELHDADDGRNGNLIRNNTIVDNQLGIFLRADAQNSEIRNNQLNGNLGEAIRMELVTGHHIEGNQMSGIPSNPALGSDKGVLLVGASNNVFLNNTIQWMGDAGIHLSTGSNNNRVEGNTLFRNGDAGVLVQDAHGAQIRNNIAHQNSDGGVVLNNANDTVISGNDLRFNPSGVEANGANHLVVENNDGSESLQAGFELASGIGMIIRNNLANRSGGAGFAIEATAFDAGGNPIGGALIEGNTANGNRASGFSIAEGGHTITDNNAHNNAGFGILAGTATGSNNFDGGGNQATGNTELAQCVGVVCGASGTVPPSTPDTTPPDVTISDGPGPMSGTVSNSTSATFVFTGTDNVYPATALTFECRLDAPPDPTPTPTPTPDGPPQPGATPTPGPDPIDPGNWAGCVSPQHYHNLLQGAHHFEVRARDRAIPPNTDLTPARYNWSIDITSGSGIITDTTAPNTRISTAPANPSISTAATFYFAGSDNLTPGTDLTFECQIDGGGFTACTSPKTYTGLAAGARTFAVRAKDSATPNNVDASPATHTWTIIVPPTDTTPPDTTIGSGPDPVTILTAATFTFASNETGATFECSIDGGATYAACTSPKSYTGLAVGAREFRVRAIDAAGNVDASPAVYTWTITAGAVPTTVTCNQVIMQSIIVNNDLLNCSWDGLVVGAPNITIDLNGRTIDGVGLAAGIRNDGHDNVTIKNGTVAGFDYGVMLNAGTVGNIVEGMTLQSNQDAGIGLGNVPPALSPSSPQPDPPPASFQSGVNNNILRNNTLLSNNKGVWLVHRTEGTLISNNLLASNTKEGVHLERAHNNRVENNDISGSTSGAVMLHGANSNTIISNTLTESGAGVHLAATISGITGQPSNNNVVQGNSINDINGDALEITSSQGNQLINNSAHEVNGSGINLYQGNNNTLRGNDVSGNKTGISLKQSSGNVIEANNTSESQGDGIDLQSQSLNNDLIRNISNNNDSDGIYIADETTAALGMLLEGNTTNSNVGFGIYVSKVSHTFKDNIANDNGGWGIWASNGSNGKFNIDSGGNRAQGNHGPLDPATGKLMQCFTIQCTGGPVMQSDDIPPDTLLLQAPPNPDINPIATFQFSGSDNAGFLTFQCKVDGGSFTPCASPASYTLTVATHVFVVRAVDLVGNVDPSPITHTWTIAPAPAGAPETTITSGPDLTTVNTNATFTFVASEAGSTFACALDAGSYAPCTSPKSYSGLTAGPHTFSVRATDLAAETDATPATYAWTIGTAPTAAEVACGQVIVQSTRLLNDLLNCSSHGLVIGANGITIDLNGHLIDGIGIDAGILNNGYDSVTIMNGTLVEFDYGVLLNPGTALNVLTGLQVEGNQEAGIALSDADQGSNGNTIRNNTVTGNAFGIALYSNTRYALVRDNALGGNIADGIRLEFSSDNRIEANEIANAGGYGIALEGGGNNTVIGNLLSENAGFGIAVGAELIASNGNRIERNTISGGQGGIGVTSSNDNQVLFNTVSGASGAGVVLDIANNTLVRGNDLRSNASGIALDQANTNRLEANIAGGSLGTGIEVGALSYNNVVVQNSAGNNAGAGIEVVDTAPAGSGNLIDRNSTDGNGGDGITISGAGHTVSGNRAQLNLGWGIFATAGTTDAGGNFAAGNVELTQCFNVVCTLGAVSGTPETRIVSAPATTSNSRNASFTYTGSDVATPLNQLIFECRLDSTNELAWADCEYPQEYLNLSPGEHIFEVRAVDAGLLADPTPARHTWTYVPLPTGVAPAVTIDIAPDAETWQTDLLFVFHANEPDVTFECKVDLFAYAPCGFESVTYMSQGAFEWGLTEIEAGLHTFYVRAIDFEGNIGTPATYTWRLLGVVTTFTAGPGFTPGATPQDPPTGGPVATHAATITFEANVADATFQCSLDLAAFTPCTSPVSYSGLLAGAHELRVFATDIFSNTELEPATYDWEIVPVLDVNPPDTTLGNRPANNSSATVFEFTGVDDMTPPTQLTFECRVDSANNLDWEACVSPFNLLTRYTYQEPQMAPGQHVFEVRAIDLAEPLDPNAPQQGNVDPSPAAYTWTMTADVTAPGTGILTGPITQTGATNAEFTFVGSDNATPATLLTFQCAVDGGLYTACTSPRTLSSLTPGVHVFGVRAIDLAGNIDATPITRTWTIVAAPVTTITAGPGGQIVNGQPPATPSTAANAIFVFASNQTGSTFACSFNGAAFSTCTSPRAYTLATNGTYRFAVRATNAQGVVEVTPVVYEWVVELGPDVTAPDTTITAQPPVTDTNTVATFSFTGSDNRTLAANLTFQCALDGTAYNSCVSPQQFSDLTRATHVMRIRARDAAGNFDLSPAVYTWTVEPPPVTVILTSPAEVTESRVATFTFQADVPGATFQCWLDGVLETACTSPKVYSDLTPGEHLFAVLATAPNGTVELDWEEYPWTIGDLSAPITTISSGPDLETTVISATFVFSANEPDATFTCSLDGSTPLPCTSPRVYPQLVPGLHRFVVVAASVPLTNALGQPLPPLYEPAPVVYEWTIVDNEAPDTIIQYGPPTTTASIVAYFGFYSEDPTASLECSLDGAIFGGCSSPATFDALTPITHTLAVRAVDLAGNIDLTPATYTWRVVQGTLNTPVGTNVTVNLPLPAGAGTATVNFFEVTLQGVTSLSTLTSAPPLPVGYLSAGGRYYDISTTAEWGSPATLCIPYNPADFSGLAARLLQFDGLNWVDVTVTNNPTTGLVCGQPDSFTLFALVSGDGVAPLAAISSGPTNPSSSGTATFVFGADQLGATLQCSLDGLPFVQCASPVTYTHLDNGSHDFRVQAIAADGQIQLVPALYEWEIILGPDTTPPSTTILQGPPSPTVNFISNFAFTGNDDQTAPLELEFVCTLDGVTLGTCSSPEEVTVLAGGVHTFTVSAVDLAGNVDPTPAVRSWLVIDLSAPDTTIDLGPASEITSTSAIFEFSGIDGLTEVPVFDFHCALDNADFTPCTSPHTVMSLTVGAHVFRVRAVDLTGVVDPSPDFYEWLVIGTVDTTPPDTFIVAGPPVGNSGPDVIFSFASNEPVTGFECLLDGGTPPGTYEACDPTYELIDLMTGTHTLLVRAIDLALNVDASPVPYTWTTVSEPDTFILSGPLTQTNSVNATFVFTSNQTGATFQCSIDGTAFIPCTSPYLAGPLLEDTHQFEVRAVNQFLTLEGAQVVDQTPATYEWEVLDITPPDTTILTVTLLGPTDLIEPNSLRFEFTGTDNRTASFDLEFECALDTGPFEGCTSPHYLPLAGLTGGGHTLRVRAVDELGNVDLSPDSYGFTTAGEPNTQINSGPPLQTESITATFSFTSTHLAATFQCSLDLAAYAACSSPVTFTNVPYGEHQLLVRAIAIDGTVETTPAEYTWTSGDLTPPVVTILTGPPITTTVITATFTFTSDDPAALFQCSLDGATLTFCTSGVVYTGLLAGEHTLEVVATKPNLLAEALPAEWTWTVIDPTAPETTIVTSPAAVIALGAPAAFTFSSNEPGVTFACALNGAVFSQCATPPSNSTQFTGLAVGAQSLLVRAVDASLNVDASPAAYTWTVVGPPLTTLVSVPPTTTVTTTATFSFNAVSPGGVVTTTFQCALDGAAPTACTSPVTYTGLAVAAHSFSVRATNSVGLSEATAVSYNWTVVAAPVAPNTPAGSNVSVILPLPVITNTVTVTFATVTTAGTTSVTTLSSPPALPAGFLTAGAQYYDISTTAVYTAPVTVCLDYTAGAPVEPVRLLHYAGGVWVDITTTSDPVNSVVCGVTSSLSPFALATAAPTLDTVITSAPPTQTVSTTANFTFASNDAAATFECTLDAPAAWGSCPANVTFTGLTTTTHTLLVRAKNAQGVVDTTPAGHTWTVLPLPETTILTGPVDPTESITATFTFSSDQPTATFECALTFNGSPVSYAPCTSGISYSGLSFGEHEFLVRAKDTAGNVDPTPADYGWTIGDIPPAVTITSAPTATTESSDATFVFAAPEAGLTYECALDGALFAVCTSPKSYSGLPLGARSFQVRVFSPAAVVPAPITTHTWTIADLTVPETAITATPVSPISSDLPSVFSFTSNEVGATFECALNGALFASCTSPTEYSDLVAGVYTFTVRALDGSGNVDLTPASHSWTVLAPPETIIVSAPPITTTSSVVTFTFASNDPAATFECKLDGGPLVACPTPYVITGLADGEHTLLVNARNAAGIVDLSPEEWTWTVELLPDTMILSGPPVTTTSNVATFVLASNEASVIFQCALDGAAFAECFTPHSVSGLTVGPHLLQVRTIDATGNIDATPASYPWTVLDGTAPETIIDSSPALTTTETSATFTFSANEPGVTFACALDGGALAPCSSPYTATGLTISGHTFAVQAIDAAGNVDATPATYAWAVVTPADTVAPETTITNQPPNPSNSSVNFAFTGTDNVTPELLLTFQCRLDGVDPAPWVACANPQSYTDLSVTPHTFEVRAVDAAGNVDATPASYSWTVTSADTTPPETTVDSGPLDPTTETTATFTFSSNEAGSTFICALDGVAAPCSSPFTYTAVAQGDHIFLVRAVDPAGNQDATAAVYEWTVGP